MYCLHVKFFLGDENNIHTAQNTTPTQNIYEKIDKQLSGFYL